MQGRLTGGFGQPDLDAHGSGDQHASARARGILAASLRQRMSPDEGHTLRDRRQQTGMPRSAGS